MLIFAGVSRGSYIWHGGSLPNSSVRPAARRHSPRTVARDLAPRRRRLHGWTRIDRTARRRRSRRRMEIDGLLPNQSGRQCRRRVPAAVWESTGRASERLSDRASDGTGPAARLSCLLVGWRTSPFDRLLRQDRGMIEFLLNYNIELCGVWCVLTVLEIYYNAQLFWQIFQRFSCDSDCICK